MKYDKIDNSLSGKTIYRDKKHRTLYYNKNSKKGYVIAPGTEKVFYNWSMRYMLGLIAFIFLELLFLHNVIFSIGIALGLTAFMEYKYRKLLNTYPMIQNFDITSAKKTDVIAPKDSKAKSILKAVLYLILAVLLVANVYVTESISKDIVAVVISYLAAAGSLYMAIKLIISFVKSK